MGSRWVVWVLSLVCASAIAITVSHVARAAAPICDDRGASAIAPPPVLPVGEHAWDADCVEAWIACVPIGLAFAMPVGAPTAILERNAVDQALLPAEQSALGKRRAQRIGTPAQRLTLPSGHYRLVYRPPRTEAVAQSD